MLNEFSRRARYLLLGCTAVALLAAGALARADAPAQAQASSASSSAKPASGAAGTEASGAAASGAATSSSGSAGAAASAGSSPTGTSGNSSSSSSTSSAAASGDGSGSSQNPRVRVTTSMGSFVIELYPDRAPLTVANFLRYVRGGQYTNTLFHRVIANFVVQGGGHDATTLRLKPTFPPVPNESGNGLQNKRGWVGLARASAPHSGNCQFYINLVDNPELDPLPTRWGYAVFGQVIQGMDVIDRIGVVPTGSMGPFKSDAPLKPVIIEKIDLLPAGTPIQPSQPVATPTSSTPHVLSPQ